MTFTPHERESIARRLHELETELNSAVLDLVRGDDFIAIRREMLEIISELRGMLAAE